MIALTKEQFQELIGAVKSAPAEPGDDQLSEEELMAKHLRRAGVYKDPDPRTMRDEWTQPCLSPATGSKFDARIVRSREFPDGLVVDLLNYAYPEDLEKRYTPQDAVKFKDGRYTPEFKQWRYKNFYFEDMSTYVKGGKFKGDAKHLPVAGERIKRVLADTPAK